MYDQAAQLQELLEPVVSALGYELVGIEHVPGKRRALVRIYIDSEQGISLADCERVSHQVSGVLDVEDPVRGEYSLEVSSPGLDRRLFTLDHFRRFAGRWVRLELGQPVAGRRKFKGRIDGVAEGDVLLTVDGEAQRVPFRRVNKARLVPEDV